MTYLRSLLLVLGISLAVAALRPVTASASSQTADHVQGRVLLTSSAFSSSRPSAPPAYVLAVVVGSEVITVNLAEDAVVVGSDGQPGALSRIRANDSVQLRGIWASSGHFSASWVQWSAG